MAEKKIVGEVEEFICTEYAKGTSSLRIAKYLKEKGNPINQKSIWDYLNDITNLPTINKFVDKFRNDPMSVDISHKKIRMFDLDKVRKTLLRSMDRYTTEDGVILEKKTGKYLGMAKRLIEIEIAARDEIEKKPDLLAMWEKTTTPYSSLTDEELRATDRRITERLILLRKGEVEAGSGAGSQGASSPAAS